MPVVPAAVSGRVREIFAHGQERGLDPQAFSKVGDCEATPTWFLGDFDLGAQYYSLGEYTYLEGAIANFQGSFERQGLATYRGFTAASALTTLWADPKQCQPGETPIDCEVRLHRPAFALVMLGTNDVHYLDSFEANLRRILDDLIEQGVVPILATKADNLEGDYAINAVIARTAYEYELPLWNFWAAVQPLPDHGLQEDGSHLTWAGNHFDDPLRMQAAWPWRNLTALQTLDAVWRGVIEQ